MIDYILVGQGLAGSLLSHFLLKKGKTVAFVDNNHKGASSAVAAGIINPITGRNFVKSWRTDELQPLAFSTYDEISALLGVQIFYPINVAVLFREIETSNNWLGRLSDPALEGYIAKEFDLNAYQKTFGNSVVSGAEFEQSGRCDIPTFILKWKDYLIEKGIDYLQEEFDYNQLQISSNSVSYKTLNAKSVIFCEGHAAEKNPFFSQLHFSPAKGEILLVKIQNYPFKNKMVKDGIFIVHLKDDIYWVGSSYNRDFEHSKPSKEACNDLINELTAMLNMPFELIDHLAAIRPTVRDRKPYLGVHPLYNNVYIFNGLGAKGSSLGPYFASHFANYLNGECALDKDVNISRIKQKTN